MITYNQAIGLKQNQFIYRYFTYLKNIQKGKVIKLTYIGTTIHVRYKSGRGIASFFVRKNTVNNLFYLTYEEAIVEKIKDKLLNKGV